MKKQIPLIEFLKLKKGQVLQPVHLMFFFPFLIGLLIYFINFGRWDFPINDFFVRWSIPSMEYNNKLSNNIVMVLYNNKTLASLGRVPNVKDHRVALEAILEQKPRAVIYSAPWVSYLVAYEKTFPKIKLTSQIHPLNPLSHHEQEIIQAIPLGSSEEQQKFAESSKTSSIIYAFVDSTPLKNEHESLKLPYPFDNIDVIPGPLTGDYKSFGLDGVTRRLYLDYQGQPMGQLQIASFFNSELKDINKVRGRFEVLDSHQAFIRYHQKDSFKKISFEDLLPSSHYKTKDIESSFVSDGTFTNKIVLIGEDLTLSNKNLVISPFSNKGIKDMTITELQANIIETLINNSSPVKLPDLFNFLFIIIFSYAALAIVIKFPPLKGVKAIILIILVFCFISWLTYNIFGIWLLVLDPLASLIISYYVLIGYHLVLESKKNWELTKKNELLVQVEELKSNFISMISHDIRTPIARIQGMVEVFLQEESLLNQKQLKSIDIIKSSCDDLLRFINSVLNYAKIESHGVELNKKSTDINELIKNVIESMAHLTQDKNIEIRTELEPLFSISIDEELIRQALSNLIENAIKYSPKGSKILVTSEESSLRPGFVQIQVSDQGEGIPEEDVPHIFMKFFRSKNVKISSVKGSGLGLYLSKYFVDLHQGSLKVETALGQGTTFILELPH